MLSEGVVPSTVKYCEDLEAANLDGIGAAVAWTVEQTVLALLLFDKVCRMREGNGSAVLPSNAPRAYRYV